jgi:hypothetical protein
MSKYSEIREAWASGDHIGALRIFVFAQMRLAGRSSFFASKVMVVCHFDLRKLSLQIDFLGALAAIL